MSESSSPNTLNDQTLLDLYTSFQGERRSLGAIYPFPLRDDFLDRGSYQGIALPVVMMAREEILAITINIRRSWYDLHSIGAWSKVFESVTEAEKWQALYEFVFPIISLSLFAPYSIKQMLVKSIYRTSYQTNKFIDSNRNPKHRDRPGFKHAMKVAEYFTSWPKLRASLSLLNDANYTNATENFRNRHHHGFPPRIEIGQTLAVQQKPHSLEVSGDVPPLLMSDLIPLLAAEYEAALNCYYAYIELVKEQQASWPSLAPREEEK